MDDVKYRHDLSFIMRNLTSTEGDYDFGKEEIELTWNYMEEIKLACNHISLRKYFRYQDKLLLTFHAERAGSICLKTLISMKMVQFGGEALLTLSKPPLQLVLAQWVGGP